MKRIADRGLVNHIVLILCLKIVTLFILWWVFVKDYRVNVDDERVTTHFFSPSSNTQSVVKGETYGR